MQNTEQSERLVELISGKLGRQIIGTSISYGDACVVVSHTKMIDFFKLLKLDSELGFNYLVSITAVDWLDKKELRFEVVYHLLSIENNHRVRVRIFVDEENPEVETVSNLWSAALVLEREVWDMYGIKFKGHPDLRRILMYDEFEGHPLRKDYPVTKKQPRIQLRHPEVVNTSQDMQRDELPKDLDKGERAVND